MPEYSTLSSKGQFVIPKKIREQTGWQPGDELEIEWMGDRLELRKKVQMNERPQASLVRELLGKYRTDDTHHVEDEMEFRTRELRKNLHGKIDS